jgi:chromosome segregation ATPase
MKTEELSSETAITASVAELRERFPQTRDLYREVCVLLFFRHGITPTANKLYQLVRKGSMSAPTQALNQFWKTLRERSRVTVEHSDLPDELRTAAGDLVATLWKSAQSKSLESLSTLQAEAAAVVERAKASLASAQAERAGALQALADTQMQLGTSEDAAALLRQELAAAAATRDGLERRLEDARRELDVMQARMEQSSAEHTAERERLADRTRLAEDRFAHMERRALLEIDRERTAAAKLQKKAEVERAEQRAALERARTEQNATQATIGQFKEQTSALQNSVRTLTNERDRERAELQSVRERLEAAIRQAATDSARANLLREELERSRAKASTRQEPSAQRSVRSKRSEKGGRGSDK